MRTCEECGARLLTPEQAAMFLGKGKREIYRDIEEGALHFIEIGGGELLVCCD